MPDLMKVRDVVAASGLGRTVIYEAIRDGELVAVRRGDPRKGREAIYVPRVEYDRWIAGMVDDARARARREQMKRGFRRGA